MPEMFGWAGSPYSGFFIGSAATAAAAANAIDTHRLDTFHLFIGPSA
jgi:hypothetical protein